LHMGSLGVLIRNSGAGRARTDDPRIMSSEAMTGTNTVERG